ncbi:MAG: hydantoinase/carbamoylase family amidase [Chloroflexi bacterium]|nr:hydantoinase/carbamoylase family amidase [Chloroflexota bacterium]
MLGMLGSRALTGQITAEYLSNPRSDAETCRAGLARLQVDADTLSAARRDPTTLLAFVELHIEQGARLQESGIDIGVATSIVGIRSFFLSFSGQAAHAGTMPMSCRADALLGASDFVQKAQALVMEHFSPGVMNCGQIQVLPGAFNIVPGLAKVALEFRHASEEQLHEMQEAILAVATESAATHGLKLTIEASDRVAATPLSEHVLAAVEAAATRLELRHTRLISFAGHDTQVLASMVPSALIFVPSQRGISHNPQEYTHPPDVANGANILLHTLLELAARIDTRVR